ncbi:MAG TPA: GNAT family N-acetyltransferase [Terriglobales bacterium]|nr:GNAT family N-acetyltransferase [Terriglobales bacterium]
MGAERSAEFHTRLAEELLRPGGDWHQVVLGDVVEGSPLLALWSGRCAAAGWRQAAAAAEVCYYLPLPSDEAALWRQLRAEHPQLARNQRRYRRRLEQNHQAQFFGAIAAADVAAAMGDLARLHALARHRKNEAGNFDRSDYRAFHLELAQRLAAAGGLYMARLACQGATVAVLYGFSCGGVLYYYQSGFDTAMTAQGAGKVLMGWVIEDAVTRLGAREFDFLRGAEEYKTRWTAQARHTTTLLGWRGGRGLLVRQAWAWRRRAATWRARAGGLLRAARARRRARPS